MGPILGSLLKLQGIEHDLTHVRRRLRSKENAVRAIQARIDELAARHEALKGQLRREQGETDGLELDRRSAEDQITHLRTALHRTKTNKEYAAILTQINTLKADNAKLEEGTLRIMHEVDGLRADAERIQQQIDGEKNRLNEILQTNAGEVERLNGMMEELLSKRSAAAEGVASDTLGAFERVAERYEGEAMANIEVHGKKPPYDYICGGCFMTLNAEHANALQTRDEIRTCDNCGRILYLEPQQEPQP
jgi:predicted  nucleic acid-binding Zn-ribbon protein